MARHRLEKLASSVHITNNIAATDKEKEDKLWKIRPWLSALRSQYLKIPAKEFTSVDEIMVPFKGKSSINQYIRLKPNPWGSSWNNFVYEHDHNVNWSQCKLVTVY